MAGNGRKNADALALALASGESIVDAAAKAGMGERTAYRYMDDSDFRRRVHALRAELVGQAMGRMSSGMTAAADVLRALLAAEGESVRLGAARAILDLGTKLRDSVELEARIADLESRIPGKKE